MHAGDCRVVMATLPASSVDAVVTDPPYGLNFMGKAWDDGVAFRPETWAAALRVLKPGGHMVCFGGTRTQHRMACAVEDAGFEIRDSLMWIYGSGFPKNKNALKPAHEPIILARKPLVGTVAGNTLAHGVGGLNIDACRIECEARPIMVRTETVVSASSMAGVSTGATNSGEMTNLGRWPANVILDGSDEVLEAFAVFGERGAAAPIRGTEPSVPAKGDVVYGFRRRVPAIHHGDTGTAARFFYSAKASAADRAGSKHPTVKPQALMRWLCRLVTPPDGTILDPFAGTGSTLQAARDSGFNSIGIEVEAEYFADMQRRLGIVA